MNADFVPVALKSDMVKSPADDEEGRLFAEIGRSRLWHQGMCALNSAGKVLTWTIHFDDDPSVLAFLDHCAKRFTQFPDASKKVATERYAKFPSETKPEIADTGITLAIPDRHPEGKHCPGTNKPADGTILTRVFGRALDQNGKPMADTVPQENYVEDHFIVPVDMQIELARALAEAGEKRFPVPDHLARLMVSHAFLGPLDVNPLGIMGGRGGITQSKFWAQKLQENGQVHVTGESEAAGSTDETGRRGDRAIWGHKVRLTWEGYIDLKDNRMTRIIFVARGSERLVWANPTLPDMKWRADVTALMAGHAINLDSGVTYGVVSEP